MAFLPADLNRALNQDAFSRVLDMLRLRGTSVRVGELSRGARSECLDNTPCLYVVHDGALLLTLPNSNQPIEARNGDVLLLVHGHSHRLTCSAPIVSSNPATGPQSSQYLRGEFEFDSIFADRLLAVLPSVILLRRPDRKPYEWVDLCFSFIVDEAVHGLAGSTAMISRLLDLLFVRTLRTWASESRLGYGWVTGAVDARIGKVLAAIHQDPARTWSLSRLAALANMSRTAFTNRFTSVVGQSPIAYLNDWRLDHAADLLRRHKLSVRELTLQTGYTSEAAFGRAFKARHGRSPMRWRSAVVVANNSPGEASQR
jgi:AraC-like DNA-binding protein